VKLLAWTSGLPNEWSVKPLRALAKYWVSNVDKIPSDDEMPVRLCNYSEVYKNEFVTLNLEFMWGTATKAEILKFRLAINDVVITKDSEDWNDIGVPALVCETTDDLICGYHLAILRPNDGRILGRFLFRCLQAKPVRAQLELAASDGVTRFGLSKSEIGGTWVPVPPLDQQQAIADYLDRETARIDALIAAKERLLVLLAEKRQALITRAVTRGLDPNVPLRDSGIPWLGMIPAHWKVVRLRFLVQVMSGATPDTGKSEYWDGEIPWVSPKDMKRDEIADSEDHVTSAALTDSALRLVPIGAVLVVVRGMILAHSFPVALTVREVTINQDMKALLCRGAICPQYLRDFLRAVSRHVVSLADSSAHGTRKLETEILGQLLVCVPPMEEQVKISTHVAVQTAELDRLSTLMAETIALLKERRAALIAAAVTGQIHIPSEAVA